MKHLYKNDSVYPVSVMINNIGDALNYVRQEWPSEDVQISITGNKISVIFDGQYEERPITLVEYEWKARP